MLAIGIMSGTSLDGVDAALVEIKENDKFSLIDFVSIPYEKEFKEKIKRNLSDETAKLSEICSLNYELSYHFKDAIDLLIGRNNLIYSDISFIASHGQTIWHEPHPREGNVASTLQIGDGQIISTLTGIPVVFNFRVSDIVCGGEGAPLVPMFEYLFFKKDDKDIVLQNIGGIGNLTYLKRNCQIDDVLAFDTGPGNVIIDYFMNKYYNKPYDDKGRIAKSGMVILPIIEKLMEEEYIKRKPPKSTGRETYSKENLDRLEKELEFEKYNKEDIIATISEFTVLSIVYNYKTFIKDFDEVIVSGGGSHNDYIMDRLNEELDNEVHSLDELYSTSEVSFSDAKEAFAFAVLGYLSLNGRAGNVKSSTGAKESLVLGEVTLARKA